MNDLTTLNNTQKLLAGTLALVLVAGFAPYLVIDAFALTLSWSGTGSSGADPLGHTWQVNFFGTNNWGTPGVGAGQLSFLGGDWVSDFHFEVFSLPPGCAIDPSGDTRFFADGTQWDRTIVGDTIWFEAADQVADRLDPGELFFVNVSFTCDISTITFDALWSMGPDDVIVGGEIIPLDTTALLLAGAQSVSMWMIPVVVSGAGIGVFVIMRSRK